MPSSLARTFEHQLAHARGIRLALHGLHHGADDRAGRLHLAIADLRDTSCERSDVTASQASDSYVLYVSSMSPRTVVV